MSPEELQRVWLNGDGDLAMDGSLRPYIGTEVEILRVTKSGLYQIRTHDGKCFSVRKRNLDGERDE